MQFRIDNSAVSWFQLRNEVGKLDQKLGVTENLVEHKVC
jgi:hypothetical protein